MALTNNPNKTRTIEKRWNQEISVRWSRFFAAINKLPLSSLVINLDDEDQGEVNLFLLAFASLADQILLSGNGGEWQNKYQTIAYRRSAERAANEAKALLTTEEIAGIFLFSAIANLDILPANRNELNFLHGRANDKLTGWVELLKQDAKSIVHDNFGKLSKDQIIALLKERLDVTASRARMIATTEITQASQRAVTVQAQEIEASLGEEVNVRWITVRDSRVRHLHAGWHGKVFTPKQAEINMNISPWNCRCGLKAVIKDRDPPMLQAKFTAERKILLARESKNLAK